MSVNASTPVHVAVHHAERPRGMAVQHSAVRVMFQENHNSLSGRQVQAGTDEALTILTILSQAGRQAVASCRQRLPSQLAS